MTEYGVSVVDGVPPRIPLGLGLRLRISLARAP